MGHAVSWPSGQTGVSGVYPSVLSQIAQLAASYKHNPPSAIASQNMNHESFRLGGRCCSDH